jgi:xylulokinase
VPQVLGVDSSTQSTKVEVRDVDDGTVLATGSSPHPLTTPPRSEQAPEDWWGAFGTAYAAAGGPRVDAVSVAGQQHGLVTLDARRSVIRPAILWNDTRSADDAAALVDQHHEGAQGWANACGSVPVASFTISKLRWLRRNEPESFGRLRHIALPHDWLTLQLSGALVTDRGDASGTGYWSPAEGRWRTDLLDLVDPAIPWEDLLPRVLGPIEPAGEWNGAVVGPGTGDNMAAALGLGLGLGDLVVSLGTSGVVSTRADSPTADASGEVAGFADAAGTFLPLVCTLNAMKVTDAVARLLGFRFDELEAAALSEPSGAGGLTLLPYFDGERTPNRPDATGAILGLRSDVTKGQLARAAIEGVVCGLLDGIDAIRRSGAARSSGQIALVGGGSRSKAFRQILADLSGRAVASYPDKELVAAGACVQAAAVLRQQSPTVIAESWGLRDLAVVTEPSSDVDVDEVRARYAALREANLA